MSEEAAVDGGTSATSEGILARVMRGSAAMFLVSLVNIAGQLLIVPVALNTWGAVKYGEWLVLTGIVSFITMSDLGLQTHVVNRMCAHHARGDREAFLSDLHSALRLQRLLLGALGLIGLGAAFAVPVDGVLQITTGSARAVTWTVLFLGFELLLCVPMGVVAGAYRATGFFTRAALISVGQRLLQFAIPITMMAMGASFPAMALARVLLALAISAFQLRDLRRVLPWFRVVPLGGSLALGAAMLAPGVLFLLLGVSEYLNQQGAIFVLQRFVGGDEVTRFVTHRTAVNIGRMLSGMVTAAIWVELTALEARDDLSRLRGAHLALARFNGWLVGLAMLFLLPMGTWVYSVWTTRQLSLDMPTFLALLLQTALWGVWTASATVLAATNNQGRLAAALFIAAGINFALCWWWIPMLGIRGAAYASLAADLLVSVWVVPWQAIRALRQSGREYAVRVVPAFLLGVLVPGILAGATWTLVDVQWVRVTIPTLAVGLGVVAISLLLSASEKSSGGRMLLALKRRLPGLRRA